MLSEVGAYATTQSKHPENANRILSASRNFLETLTSLSMVGVTCLDKIFVVLRVLCGWYLAFDQRLISGKRFDLPIPAAGDHGDLKLCYT
jgi:hypothetical protein